VLVMIAVGLGRLAVGDAPASTSSWQRTSLGGRRVGIRIEPAALMFHDLDSCELLRTRTNPLQPEEVRRLCGLRPAGPPPRPSIEPIRVRRASATGVILVAG
jgi:hypothetical protein